MDKQHEIIKDKVCDWFQKEKPNCNIEKEVQYSINLPELEMKKQFFQVDVVVTDDTGKTIGVECKSLRDSNTFRKLSTGIGQAYILQKVFGKSYLALESRQCWSSNRYELSKRTSLLPNISRELGIGILFVDNEVECVEKPRLVKPAASSLFVPKKKKQI